MILRTKALVMFTLFIFSGCTSIQKRDVAQAESTCYKQDVTQTPNKGDYIFFREKQQIDRIQGNNSIIGKRGTGTQWMNVSTHLDAGDKVTIDEGMALKVVEFGCTTNNVLDGCGDVILESTRGRKYFLNCGGYCDVDEYNLYFTKSQKCEEVREVPASAPVESAPTNSPVEI